MTDNNSLSHTKWNCKYHIIFSPKYRRKEIYGKLKTDIGKILRQLCIHKHVEIIEAECKYRISSSTCTEFQLHGNGVLAPVKRRIAPLKILTKRYKHDII